jgi:hypothetical protein
MFDKLVNDGVIFPVKGKSNNVEKTAERIIKLFERENVISIGKLKNIIRSTDENIFNEAIKLLEDKKLVKLETIENKYRPGGFHINVVLY